MIIFGILFLIVYVVVGVLFLFAATNLYKFIVSFLERNEVKFSYFLKIFLAFCITCIAVVLSFFLSNYIYNYIVHLILPSGGY